MFKVETQESYSFDDLTSLQCGWEFSVSQLGPSEELSHATLYQTPNITCNSFQFGSAYDQCLRSREGFLSFGLLSNDNPTTWAHHRLIPNDGLTVFPHDDDLKGVSPVGFRGSGIHFAKDFITSLAEQVYNQPINLLVPSPDTYMTDVEKLGVLRAELRKWRELASLGADIRPDIITCREESLALAVINALIDEKYIETESLKRSTRSVSLALKFIHSSELDSISAMELCEHTKCSQRTLEKCFSNRFGVTPKKYIKCLRLAEVHKGLQNFDACGYDSIIELAGINGFWHMGQFAADYRRIYGELPSDTLNRKQAP
jgi:AraC family ethanolamine operon transcriptional activator